MCLCSELSEGLKVVDEQGNKLASSKVCITFQVTLCMYVCLMYIMCHVIQVAARYGVGQTLLSRVLLASVVMGEPPTPHSMSCAYFHMLTCIGLPAALMYTFEKTAMFKVN